MGFAAVIKRLLAHLFGPEETLPCDSCRAPIPRSEFDKGRAVVVAKLRYCPKCVGKVIGRSAGGVALDASSSSIHGPTMR